MKIIKNTDFEDRISQLPDDILEIILSFLQFRQAVRTGILSKRWKNLWVSMPKVEFDFSWGNPPEIFNLPDGVLKSTTLKELTIRHPLNALRFPRPFDLPNLRVLHLQGCRFYNYDKVDEEEYDGYCPLLPHDTFISGFSNLEKLTLDSCSSDDLIISAPKLRFLELACLNHGKYQPEIEEISAHQLTSLSYEGANTLECKRLDCPRLEELYISMWARFSGGPKAKHHAEKELAPKLIEMLQRFGNHAKFVTFTMGTIKILAADNCLLERSPSPFPNLKHLKFQRNSSWGCKEMEVVPAFVMKYLTKECSHDVLSSYLPDS